MISARKTAVALFLLCGVARAQDAIDRLSEIAPGRSAEYIALRESFDASDLPLLKAAATPGQWTRENWTRALAAEACRLRIEEPELAAELDRPRGLDPNVYRNFRRPVPLCLRQFRHVGVRGIPLLLERWRWTFSEHPFSGGDAGREERKVFRQAIIAAAGQTGDVRARFFLEEILANENEAPMWRSEAAVSLGMCAGEKALPTLLEFIDGKSPLEVRRACARALGRVPTLGALDAIRFRLGADPDLDLDLVTALGLLGSEWGWKSRGAGSGKKIRKGCADALVQQITRIPGHSDSIGRALALVAWPESLARVEALKELPAAREILLPLRRALGR